MRGQVRNLFNLINYSKRSSAVAPSQAGAARISGAERRLKLEEEEMKARKNICHGHCPQVPFAQQ